ncbi:vanadium-dependent haloperoxidase [Mucilaginibacter rubeus]|uniref:Vanadium-dependent haloperoxidase n=1 Tax=Mucilaginibacter rubeus TaxID=2027860 RepID=A0AAE6JB47_9SPHI|nr:MULTISPECIES: vanadium-dependent haloperoxidase [Mucilaginibacter]QEM02399.1 vanadium-dependent haloperoxidase [Mucilaginibacter rubeus]QEM15023.1 vanadium-dependent haloperoxidase [Mucilaginibacter gossypii]QTE42259.1 vanadium-dependent haloperoxidase [Mucilaginibacter rubeus]QTE48860.1 vanadium-dependent haloperoxidase [Mucilaginibacter rubeus]QTE53957.1 vanadium-dependent haloperoxidase [Mucilaginibacter rubeus]
MNSFLLWLSGIIILLSSCKKTDYQSLTDNPELYRITEKKLNDIILENNFPPVIASRNYAYANIAAYEVISAQDPKKFRSLAGQIRHLTATPKPVPGVEIDYPFASLLAFCYVGNAVTFPEGSMDEYVDALKKKAKDGGMPSDVFEHSVNYSDVVAKHIMKWSKTDHYAQTRSANKYTVTKKEGRWVPTPPMYSQALEPHWGEIRPLILDSASRVAPPPPPLFDMKDINSQFYKDVLDVKSTGTNLTKEQKHIADFWDDNAFKLNVVGHATFGTKKFSPGGHWMNIAGIASETCKADFSSTVCAYAETSIALFDAFINCWYFKYKYNLVRPETVITKYLDPDWKTYIQTPSFPEYVSGHAVISAAAAEILTDQFGDNFAYRDTSETEFGIAPRSFKSFREAAMEAGISRVYGGIHFKNSCIVGTEEGKQVGQLVLNRLHMKIKLREK